MEIWAATVISSGVQTWRQWCHNRATPPGVNELIFITTGHEKLGCIWNALERRGHVPDATSRGPCAFRSSLTPSRNSRPPAFSRALPDNEAQQQVSTTLADYRKAEDLNINMSASPTPSLRSSSAFVGLMIPSTFIDPILLISLSVSESCGFTKSPVQCEQTAAEELILVHCVVDTCYSTFCPRKRLFADRMVNPSPGPSSTVEFGTDSLSVFFDRWRKMAHSWT